MDTKEKNEKFKLDISVKKTTLGLAEPLIITATFNNLSGNTYQIMTGEKLIKFGIWEKDEERYINERAIATFREMKKGLKETKVMEYRFKKTGEYYICALANFYILSTNSSEQIQYDKIKTPELDALRESGNFIYLSTEEVAINII